MYSMNDSTIPTVVDSVFRIASENLFFTNFTEQSKAGNNHKIIVIIREIPEIKKLSIKESYLSKNNEEAEKCLRKADHTNNVEMRFSHLEKALFAAKFESNDRTIFFEALIRRIRLSFDSKHFEKCLKDCKYMASLLNNVDNIDSGERNGQELKIECLSYESRCLKMLGHSDEARNSARNGMKEAKDFFQKIGQQGTIISDAKKLEMLHPFLTVLNNSQNNVHEINSLETQTICTSEKKTVPQVSGKQNKNLMSCSDAVVLKYDEMKGRHLVATKNIKTGSVLIVDEPFTWSTDRQMLENNCLHCHKSLKSFNDIQIPCRSCQTVRFCSEDCRIESWERYHRWECVIFDYFYQMQKNQSSRLLLAYRTTVSLAQETGNAGTGNNYQPFPAMRNYYCNNDNDSKKLRIGLNETYDPLDYRTVYSLQTNHQNIEPKVKLMHTIHSVLLAKCFTFTCDKINPNIKIRDDDETILAIAMLQHLQAINSNAYEMVENVLDTQTRVWDPKTIGGAIYTTVSLTNHSCFPNVVRHSYPKGKVVVRAIRFIPKGGEILDCYGPHFLQQVRTERQKYLFEKYNFQCLCEACEENLEYPDSAALYKCKNCSAISKKLTTPCGKCGAKMDRVKIDKAIKELQEQQSIAIQKMMNGDHPAALPILLRHSETIDKIFSERSFVALKTQQALIQCLNSMGCISE